MVVLSVSRLQSRLSFTRGRGGAGVHRANIGRQSMCQRANTEDTPTMVHGGVTVNTSQQEGLGFVWLSDSGYM